jgi:hypothetical protein
VHDRGGGGRVSRRRRKVTPHVRRASHSIPTSCAETTNPAFAGFALDLVEAAGVEPASESISSQDSTCVSALQISLTTSKSDEKSWPASPGGSRDSRPRRPTITSPLNGASSPVADAQERGVAVN